MLINIITQRTNARIFLGVLLLFMFFLLYKIFYILKIRKAGLYIRFPLYENISNNRFRRKISVVRRAPRGGTNLHGSLSPEGERGNISFRD